jgi:phosphoribosylaminoimidazole carboxylase PurE protein
MSDMMTGTGRPLVAVIVGSEKDWSIMDKCIEMLDKLGIKYVRHMSSAHRNPLRTAEIAKEFSLHGIKVVIAGAGHAAHLAGVVASYTILPVIGVPLATSVLNGFDSLLSMVQMPSGVPVACMAVGEPGAKNAAVLAAEIIALTDDEVKERLNNYKKELAM